METTIVMLTFITIAVTVNLVITLAIVYQLRQRSGSMENHYLDLPNLSLPIGSEVPDLSVSSVDGSPVAVPSVRVIAFLSPGCPPCRDQLPGFVEYARQHGRSDVLAVVSTFADADEGDSMVDALRSVAEVVTEPPAGPLEKAFSISGTPVFLVIESGKVARSSPVAHALGTRDGSR